ncbi:High-affinity zinc uptake system binding-protein ZnuA precursor [compost metagenome]
MVRRLLLFISLIGLFSSLLIGCGSTTKLVDGKVNVITSFYPLYDFTSKIGGEHVNAINLVPAGVEPHDYSLKSRDMMDITKAELFVYQGAGFEGWVHDFMDSLKSDANVKIIEASKGAKLLQVSADDKGHGEEGHNHQESKDHEGEMQVDPHAWLSPSNAKKMGENIRDGLIQVDPANKADYEKNYEKFAAQMTDLDARYKSALSATKKKEIAVSHQAFAYLCNDYGLTQMSIMGLSPDSEPTAQDLKQINAFIKEHDVKYIFFEELVSDKLAKTLAKDAKIETMVLNPVEGLTEKQIQAGEDYFSVMDNNLKNIVKALQ